MTDIEQISGNNRCKLTVFFTNLLDPKDNSHKYLALCLICLLGFGNCFSYDSPRALEVAIENVMSIGTSQFSSLYALLAYPSIIMCVVGGIMVDQFLGVKLAAVVFTSVLVIAQLLVALGAYSGTFWLMQIGRFLHGVGGQTVTTTQCAYLVRWFGDKKINLVFGIQSATLKLSEILVYDIMLSTFSQISKQQSMEPKHALGVTFLLPVAACLLSLTVAFVLAFIDKRADRLTGRRTNELSQVLTISDGSIPEQTGNATQDFQLKGILQFKVPYWLLVLCVTTFYISVSPFIVEGAKFFETKWHYNTKASAMITSTIYLVSMLISSQIGLMIDILGRNLSFILTGCGLVFTSHLLLGFTILNPLLSTTMIGIGWAILSVAPFPLIALLAPTKHLATAFGTQSALINLSMLLISNITRPLVDWRGYLALEVFFVLCTGTSLAFIVALIVYETRSGNESKLNSVREPTTGSQ